MYVSGVALSLLGVSATPTIVYPNDVDGNTINTAGIFLTHTRSLLTHTRSLLTHARSLLTHTRSLLTHTRSLLTHTRSLLTHTRSLSLS